ncbi:GOLPH3/VPS74 family protein [Pseudidiomarina aquimaris]|uniref:GOLPH3/VPS74 family protein n=1 Tax=Pseudidiomarina aquimaris TaxID=641841 RepID=UPI003A973937
MDIKLYEGLMLLALNEEKGTMSGAYIEYSVAAAVLAELLLLKRIQVDRDDKDKVDVVDDSPTGDKVLDEALEKMSKAKRRRKLKDWVSSIGHIKDLKHKVAEQLVEDGIIELEKKKVLWLFTQKVYPEVNPQPEQHLRHEMRRLVLDRPLEIDPRIALMLSLAQSARLLEQVFSKEELKASKKRIENIAKGEELGAIAKEVVAAVEVAVMIAVMMPAITAATTASSASTPSC